MYLCARKAVISVLTSVKVWRSGLDVAAVASFEPLSI